MCTLHAISEISGFNSLRWEDQEKIKKKISGGGGGAEGTDSTDGGPSTSKKRKVTRSDLQVEYAKSKRSTCKGCDSQIDKVYSFKKSTCHQEHTMRCSHAPVLATIEHFIFPHLAQHF